ncbi:hypothetical protein GCM10010532_054670 [Dactylosporangium siamense]|uniref:Uncharacterized protein n=1 Tax=Dactylosporangium siamense TaxID=685454 RepID=A0A919PLY4_9ACTN|nr:hypothetical protein Dsi01nite_040780 [Dactylosporangium siamense]
MTVFTPRIDGPDSKLSFVSGRATPASRTTSVGASSAMRTVVCSSPAAHARHRAESERGYQSCCTLSGTRA